MLPVSTDVFADVHSALALNPLPKMGTLNPQENPKENPQEMRGASSVGSIPTMIPDDV